MPLVFAFTLFLSALLLFLVQPMIAKMILPKFGGTPAVWNTCMVFFQAALLAGYAYAHAVPQWLGTRRQALVHLGLMLLPFLVLPIAISESYVPPSDTYPVLPMLTLLLLTVGLPFFVISTSAPLLQKWYASTGHPMAKDPYYLYAASNLGSIAALVGYPLLIEPNLHLPDQGWYWMIGYGLLVVVTALCALLLWRAPHQADQSTDGGAIAETAPTTVLTAEKPPEPDVERLTLGQQLHWVALAFVPSSLMLGVTTYLTTDIAAIPLLWVVPLAIYLLSFILVFSQWPLVLHWTMTLALPVIALLLIFAMTSSLLSEWIWVIFALHLTLLAVTSLVCHGELARTRPSPRHLTAFYLWMSVGGVLGGLFNALLAPLIFTSIAEYPITIVLACLALPALGSGKSNRWTRIIDLGVPAVFGMLAIGLLIRRTLEGSLNFSELEDLFRDQPIWPVTVGLLSSAAIVYVFRSQAGRADRALDVGSALALGGLTMGMLMRVQPFNWDLKALPEVLQIRPERMLLILRFGLPVLFCYVFVERPTRFAFCVGAFLLATTICFDLQEDYVLHRERSFFGVMEVKRDRVSIRLNHGTTLHGKQSLDPDLKDKPNAYFHSEGPIGQVFQELKRRQSAPPLAVIGLGTGTLACYAQPGQHLTYYEIDPAVVRIASNPVYFSYLTDAVDRGVELQVVLGDARLRMERVDDPPYGLLIVDAFSSDAIPVHLLTREALQLYLRKLAPDGIIAFHISNRYLDLGPVLLHLARDAGLDGYEEFDSQDESIDKLDSHWVVLAREPKHLGMLMADRRWKPLRDRPGVAVWTDDYSNLFSVFGFPEQD